MLWEHQQQASVSTTFSIVPNFHECSYIALLSLVFLYRNKENMYSQKQRDEIKEHNLFTLIIKM